jgi:hypothetical protein
MSRIKIWDYDAIRRKPAISRKGTIVVPDTKRRPDESEAEWHMRMLLRDLQALASDAATLIKAYSGETPVADDLVNDLDSHLEFAAKCVQQGLISQEMLDYARAVHSKIDEMSERNDPSLWTNEALTTREEWASVRGLAREALRRMGYELEPPPPRSM